MSNAYLHSELTEAVIGCCYNVHNELGVGFLEKVYQNALAIELKEAGTAFQQECPLNVLYHGEMVGEYIPDFHCSPENHCRTESGTDVCEAA